MKIKLLFVSCIFALFCGINISAYGLDEPTEEAVFLLNVELCISQDTYYYCDTEDTEPDYEDWGEANCEEDWETGEVMCSYEILSYDDLCPGVSGKIFSGWKELNTEIIYQPGETVSIIKDGGCGLSFLAQFVTPATIELNWYDGEDELTGANVAGSCTYGSTFNVPTPQSRTGYVFTGWKVKRCSLSYLNLSENSTTYAYRNPSGSTGGSNGATPATYGLTENGTWAVSFNSGTDILYGKVLCSQTTTGTVDHAGSPDEAHSGSGCWCKATGYTRNNEDLCPVTSAAWVFRGNFPAGTSSCRRNCGTGCAQSVSGSSVFRSEM